MKDNNEIIEKIILKSRTKIAVSEFLKEDTTMKKINNIPKMVATIAITIGIMSGLVYATANIYEKIWKEPEKYNLKQGVTEEEKKECISEEDAEKIGNDYLKKIGFDDQYITQLNLQKEHREQNSNDNIWSLDSEKVSIDIDAMTGEIKFVYISSTEYERLYNYGITREEARVTARELLEKYKPEDMEGEYELVTLRRNMETDEASYIWYADFYRKYGDLLNENEHINIGWVPTVNGLYSLDIQNDKYEANEEKVTKEEAIQIATQKDLTIAKDRKIENVKAEIKIKQMNEEAFLRENFTEEYENRTLNYEKISEYQYKMKDDAIFYKTEERVRKVWVVVVEYEKGSKGIPSYSYYIDSTTGEIIGGSIGDQILRDYSIKNDPYNLIEK